MRISKRVHKHQFNITLYREVAAGVNDHSTTNTTTNKNNKNKNKKRMGGNSAINKKDNKSKVQVLPLPPIRRLPSPSSATDCTKKIILTTTQHHHHHQQKQHSNKYDRSTGNDYRYRYSTSSSDTERTLSSSFSSSFSSPISSSTTTSLPRKKSTTDNDNNFIEVGWKTANTAMKDFFFGNETLIVVDNVL